VYHRRVPQYSRRCEVFAGRSALANPTAAKPSGRRGTVCELAFALTIECAVVGVRSVRLAIAAADG
jgi:hypothetical protein